MKISNFKLKEVIGTSYANYKFRATIDIVTGIFRKKTVTREIYKNYAGAWFFLDTGEYTPTMDVYKLEQSYEAKQRKELHQCKGE